MKFYKTWWWAVIFTTGLLLFSVFSFVLFFFNGTKLPAHHPALDFLPVVIWIVFCIWLVHRFGEQKEKDIQNIAFNQMPALLGFWVALAGGIYYAMQQNSSYMLLTFALAYALYSFGFYGLRQYAAQKNITLPWRQIWLMTLFIFIFITLGAIAENFPQIAGLQYFIIFGGIALVTPFWWGKYSREVSKSTISREVYHAFSWLLLGFLLITFEFLFLLFLRLGVIKFIFEYFS